MILRQFTQHDIEIVRRLVNESLQEDYDPTIYTYMLTVWPAGVLVAQEGNDIIGIAAGVMNSPQQVRILLLAINKRWQGRGIGSQILSAYFQRCLMSGFSTITLEVRTTNQKALSFYTRHGFSIIGTIPAYYKDGGDGYQMFKAL